MIKMELLPTSFLQNTRQYMVKLGADSEEREFPQKYLTAETAELN